VPALTHRKNSYDEIIGGLIWSFEHLIAENMTNGSTLYIKALLLEMTVHLTMNIYHSTTTIYWLSKDSRCHFRYRTNKYQR
jgi:hypothetical protein